MPSSANKIVIWTSDHNKLFKNVCKKGPNSSLADQLTEVATLLDSEFTFQFDKSSTYSSLFTITQPSSPSSTSPLSAVTTNNNNNNNPLGKSPSSPPQSSNSSNNSAFLGLSSPFAASSSTSSSSSSSLFQGSNNDSALIQSSQQEKRKRLQATLLFLDVWRHLLSIIESVSYTERKLLFRVIVGLMKRREFDVIHFKSSNMYPDLSSNTPPQQTLTIPPATGGSGRNRSNSGQSGFSGLKRSKPISIGTGDPSISPREGTSTLSSLFSVFGNSSSASNESMNDKLENQVLRQFLELSYKTQEYVIKNVLSSKQHDAIYEELYQFCAQVLAINCFRLFSPRDTQFFVEALCFKSFNAKFVSSESHDTIRRNVDGDETRQISLTYTPSTESFRSLLKNKKQQVMNRSLSTSGVNSEETEESKHIVNRLFRCYRVFFTNELQSIRRVLTDDEKSNLIMAVQSAQTYLPRFGSSHLFFFTFFTEFVRQISRLMSTETVDYWQYAPGYKLILGHYVEIAVQNVKNYMKKDLYPEPTSNYGKSSSNWIGCSFIAMKNPVFLNVLMELVFKYTSAYNLDQVFFSLVWVESWFRELSVLQHSFQQFLLNNHRLRERYLQAPDGTKNKIEIFIGELPPNFDYDFFERAIDALLSTHHFQIITRTLIFLYEVMDLFNGKERLKLIYEFLLKKHFFSLFLHWSEDARACFHRILTYKVQRYSRSDFINNSLPKPKSSNKLPARNDNSSSVLTQPISLPQASQQPSDPSSDSGERPRRTSMSGPRPVVTEETNYHHQDGGRHSLDLPSRHRPLTEETMSAPKSKLSLWQRVSLRKSNKEPKKKVSQQTLLDEHLSSEFQRTEESIDMVLKSKADSYISVLSSYADQERNAQSVDCQFFAANGLQVPMELVNYIPKALEQYSKIEKESALWRQNTTQHLMEREKKMAQTGQSVYLRRVPYPRISFPKFVLKSDNSNV